MKLLSGYEVLSYTPEMVNESRLKNGGKIILRGLMQKADTLNQNGRIYSKGILEREVRNYQKFILENRALGECVPPGTEIYTVNGWKNIEDISDNEVIATLNLQTNELEFQRINKKIDREYDGAMYHVSNKHGTIDMIVTENHNILYWDRTYKTQKISAGELYSRLKSDRPLSHAALSSSQAIWVGEDPKEVSVAGKILPAEDWAAFLGIYLAEGHCSGVYASHRKKQCSVVITQNFGETADEIREMLKRLPWNFKERSQDRNNGQRLDFIVQDKELHEHLFVLGGSREKYVPKYAKCWSPRLLDVLMTWMLKGDGRHVRGYQNKIIDAYCSSSKKLASDAVDIFLKLGFKTTIEVNKPITKKAPDFETTGRMILAENQVDMNVVRKCTSTFNALDWRFVSMTEEQYSGRVYCVNVKNGTWLMKRNNAVCWTGNCDHPDSSVVNLKNVSHVVRELKMEDKEVHGAIELLDTPSGKIVQSLVESGVKLGISSRGVGSTKTINGAVEVCDDFVLICFDVVSEPSTTQAFMIPEGKSITCSDLRTVLTRADRIDRLLNGIMTPTKV